MTLDFSWPLVGIGVLAALMLSWYLLRRILWRLFGLQGRLDEVLSQKKSSEVRLGKIAETMAPFLDDFPVPVGTPGSATVFLGQPIDYVHFSPDGSVTFVEIKSGNADLSPFQRKIRRAIEDGRIHWVEHRIDGRESTNRIEKKSSR